LLRQCLTAAEVRQCSDRNLLWPLVAAEMDAISARSRFRVIGGLLAGWRPTAGKHPEPSPARRMLCAINHARVAYFILVPGCPIPYGNN